MITEQNCMSWILQNVPGFQGRWDAHLSYWDGEDAGLCNHIAEFSRYVGDLITENQVEQTKPIFRMIEHLMLHGDVTVKDAVATCFLENLINRTSTGDIPAANFVHLLGPESRAYCRAWDEFTGVKTEGL